MVLETVVIIAITMTVTVEEEEITIFDLRLRDLTITRMLEFLRDLGLTEI